jgi:hypothetical protein
MMIVFQSKKKKMFRHVSSSASSSRVKQPICGDNPQEPIKKLDDCKVQKNFSWCSTQPCKEEHVEVSFSQHNIGSHGEDTGVIEDVSGYNNEVKASVPCSWDQMGVSVDFRTAQQYLNSQGEKNLKDIYTLQEVQEPYYCQCIASGDGRDDRDTCTCTANTYYWSTHTNSRIKGCPITVILEFSIGNVEYKGIYIRTGFIIYKDTNNVAARIFHGCAVIWKDTVFKQTGFIFHYDNSLK